MTDTNTEGNQSIPATTTTDNQDDNNAPPVVIFKKQTKNRGNMRKRDIQDTIEQQQEQEEKEKELNNSSNGGDNKNETKTDDNGIVDGGDTENRKKQKHTNQYTNIKSSEERLSSDPITYTYATSGSAKALVTEADQSTTIVEQKEQDTNIGINNNDGVYRGMKSYTNYVDKKEDLSYKGAGIKAGPVKELKGAYKGSTIIDYKPDVCKDYKETGSCSFGDACIFMHDRGDYKMGWQIDKQYEEEQRAKRRGFLTDKERKKMEMADTAANNSINLENDDELPHACFICRKPFVNPVMTKCKHFFCEQCALDYNKKSKKCFVCKEMVNGSFTQPKKIIDRIMLKSKAMASSSPS